MKNTSGPIRKACAASIALAIAVMCLPSPCRAEPPAPVPPATRSIATLSPATLALLTAQPPSDASNDETGAFFKSKKGVVVLVLLGAGFGYALYSRSHDEIKSAIRQ